MKKLLFVMLVFVLFAAAGCDSGDNTPDSSPSVSDAPIGTEDAAPADDAEEKDQSEDKEPVQTSEDTGDNDVDSEDPAANWEVHKGNEFTIKYPANWKTSEDGGLYRFHEGIEEEFASQDHFEDIGRLAEASLGFTFLQNDQEKTLEELWNEVKVDDSIKEKIFLDGEPALTANCSGIVYMECAVALHNGEGVYASIIYTSEDPLIRSEIRQMLETFTFAD